MTLRKRQLCRANEQLHFVDLKKKKMVSDQWSFTTHQTYVYILNKHKCRHVYKTPHMRARACISPLRLHLIGTLLYIYVCYIHYFVRAAFFSLAHFKNQTRSIHRTQHKNHSARLKLSHVIHLRRRCRWRAASCAWAHLLLLLLLCEPGFFFSSTLLPLTFILISMCMRTYVYIIVNVCVYTRNWYAWKRRRRRRRRRGTSDRNIYEVCWASGFGERALERMPLLACALCRLSAAALRWVWRGAGAGSGCGLMRRTSIAHKNTNFLTFITLYFL